MDQKAIFSQIFFKNNNFEMSYLPTLLIPKGWGKGPRRHCQKILLFGMLLKKGKQNFFLELQL